MRPFWRTLLIIGDDGGLPLSLRDVIEFVASEWWRESRERESDRRGGNGEVEHLTYYNTLIQC